VYEYHEKVAGVAVGWSWWWWIHRAWDITDEAKMSVPLYSLLACASSCVDRRDGVCTVSKYNTKQDMMEMQAPMWSTVQGSTNKLSLLSDNSLAIIRAEIQIICFSHLHILSTLRSLQFSPKRMRREQAQQQQAQQQQAGSQAPRITSSNSSPRDDDDDSHEAEAIINDLINHLRQIIQAIKPALTTEALALVLGPVCFLIPRILLRLVFV
jgi:hypothetical protein